MDSLSIFRTTFPTSPGPFSLSPEQGGMVLMGSCFTDEIGERLLRAGYPAEVNPCGVQYNPASIALLLRAAATGEMPESWLFEHDGRWRVWLMPQKFSAPDRATARAIAQQALRTLAQGLRKAQVLVITLGTAWVYQHQLPPYRGIVGNCHKVHPREFLRRRLSVEEATDRLLQSLEMVRDLNRDIKIIFTVSPIRHFKDGAHENTLSKATLHLACDVLANRLADTDYFPAWELLLDDLRDYRFYGPDMLHPSPTAVDYIWHHFQGRYFSPALQARLSEATRAARRAAHIPLLP